MIRLRHFFGGGENRLERMGSSEMMNECMTALPTVFTDEYRERGGRIVYRAFGKALEECRRMAK